MIKFWTISIIASLLGLATLTSSNLSEDDKTVIEVLEELGEDFESKKPDTSIPGVSAEIGKQIFHQGFADHNGRESARQSKHFVCTSCHNSEREDPDLAVNDPQARLIYTEEKGIPFLPGTTMFGAVNRESYYNGDYFLKYGDLVYEARNDIRKAIQLCATECAQGRALKDWEMESMLAYLWTLQIKMDDLDLDDKMKEELSDIENISDPEAMISKLKSTYSLKSDATFTRPPDDRKKGVGLKGNYENGKLIYNNSCLHCHYKGRYAYFHMDDDKITKNYLSRKIPTYHPHSIYQVVRWGIGSHFWNRAYMPNYTQERLSDQQLADLVAYISNDQEG